MTTRGRRPKPTHLKLVEGNAGKRPLNEREPKPDLNLPSTPPELKGHALAEWNRVAQELYDIGLLTNVDRAALAAYCQAYGVWVRASRAIETMAKRDKLTDGLMIRTTNGNAIQNPLIGTMNKAASDMVRYAAEFGMTPSARSRIAAERSPEQSDDEKRFLK